MRQEGTQVDMKNKSTFYDNFLTRFIKKNLMILIALLLMFLILAIGTDSFLTSKNIMSVLRQISINGILAFGMAMTLIVGGIDLSVGSVMAAILLTLLLGAVCGLINGMIAAFTEIPSFIITLATQQCFRGAAYLMTQGKAISCYDEVFCSI